MEGFLFQSLFICMEKNTIKDAYSKLINSDIIKKVKSMYEMEIKKAYIQGYKDRAKLSEPENI